ncbi:MAG: PA14 domain-containing protein [Anaerolineae bacterium]|nr:PA14 domain-containing protein [Anaerolineae bacterium]NUQ06319.1 SH3 domain-containing protein [Anaerolineae bacterium]
MRRRVLMFVLLTSLFVLALGQPAAAQTGVVWRGEYYNNATLSGSPALVRNDNQIGFNWASGSPDAAIQADGFTVRWAADVNLSAGVYRFYAQADDNIRIIFNFGFQPVIDTFADPSKVGQLVQGDVTVASNGTYHIQVDYREVSSTAFAYVTFANLATNPVFPGFQGQPPITGIPVAGGSWTAQYYPNATLSGDPTAIFTEGAVTHNWGQGAPLGTLPADYFSARWSSLQTLTGGAYTLSVRADDGVRVYVNGVLTIDEWHGASGATYTRSLNLPPGSNSFVVEYYDQTLDAYIEYTLSQAGSIYPTSVPTFVSPTGAVATVTAYRLNVRSAPDAASSVLIRVSRYEQYAITGRNAAATWYQIQVGGALGWVSARWINVAPFGVNVPVVGGDAPAQPPAATGNVVTATPYNVVIRQGPSTANARIGLLPAGAVVPVIGRNASNTWWQINYNGFVGWVSGTYAVISQSANLATIPVTG